MNEREREICARLKQFRQSIKLSQSKLAAQLGITHDQLASIEYGRTPLRYEIAWRIRQTFNLSLNWLWGNDDENPDDISADEKLPSPEDIGLPDNALLSEVFDKTYNLEPGSEPYSSVRKQTRKEIKIPELQISRRALRLEWLRQSLLHWFAEVPTDYEHDLYEKFEQLGKEYLKMLPADPEDVIQARLDALRWENMRVNAFRKMVHLNRESKKPLTEDSVNRNSVGVKPEIKRLIARVNAKASKPGSKAELARMLNVAPARISEWLSGKNEPGGETTLRLLHWVEQQERQK